MRWRSAVALVVCGTFASAQDQGITQVPAKRPFQLPPRIGIETNMAMTLDDVLALALRNNKDIESSRIDRDKAGNNVSGAKGYFDPRVGGTISFQKNVLPVASSLGGSTTGAVTNRNSLLDPQFSGVLPWAGSSYQLDFSSSRNTTNNTFTQLNPQYPTSLNLSFTQPLWRNFRFDDNRHRLEIAKKNQALTDEQFRQRVMQTITTAEQAYWDLVFAYRNLEVQLEAVRIGEEQDESNRRQLEQGLLAPIDVVAAQRQLANFEVSAYSAHEALTNAENTLKTLILPSRIDPLWSTAIIPMTPPNVTVPIIPLQDAVRSALAHRPEMAEVQISGEINESDNRYYREQTKPQVDLVASHTNAGLAGVQLPPAPNPFTASTLALTDRINQLSTIAGLEPLASVSSGTSAGVPQLLVGTYGQSISNLFTNNFPTTQVQLRLSLPLRNRTAEANLNNSLAEKRRIQNQREQTEQTIESGVRNTMQSMDSARLRLDAARVARAAAEQQYESEQRQFRAGTSTLFLVQQRQSDMITAQTQERRSEADLAKAIAAFGLATANILDAHNIDIR